MTQNSDDELRLRPTRLNGEPAAPDDFVVIWRDIKVGRILKQSGAPMGSSSWFWGVIIPGKPQPANHRGICSDIDECKRRFRVVWSGIRRSLTEGEIAIIRRHIADAERRARWPGTKYPHRT